MLVLSREKGQKILIGEGIVIHLVSVKGNRAQIGIEAPKHIPICREEAVKKGVRS